MESITKLPALSQRVGTLFQQGRNRSPSSQSNWEARMAKATIIPSRLPVPVLVFPEAIRSLSPDHHASICMSDTL